MNFYFNCFDNASRWDSWSKSLWNWWPPFVYFWPSTKATMTDGQRDKRTERNHVGPHSVSAGPQSLFSCNWSAFLGFLQSLFNSLIKKFISHSTWRDFSDEWQMRGQFSEEEFSSSAMSIPNLPGVQISMGNCNRSITSSFWRASLLSSVVSLIGSTITLQLPGLGQ